MNSKLMLAGLISFGLSVAFVLNRFQEPDKHIEPLKTQSVRSVRSNLQKSLLKTGEDDSVISAHRLWQPANLYSPSTQELPAEIEVRHIQARVDIFDNLTEGKKISLFIPQEQHEFIGVVEQSYRQFGGRVQVSSGSIKEGDQFSSFTVTKGPETTLVMVATGESVYQVEINNQTGSGTVIDDRALDIFRTQDDTQLTPPEGIS